MLLFIIIILCVIPFLIIKLQKGKKTIKSSKNALESQSDSNKKRRVVFFIDYLTIGITALGFGLVYFLFKSY